MVVHRIVVGRAGDPLRDFALYFAVAPRLGLESSYHYYPPLLSTANDTASGTLGIRIIAEGIEQPGEFHALRELGVRIFQGYLFARPGHRSLPPISAEGLALLAG